MGERCDWLLITLSIPLFSPQIGNNRSNEWKWMDKLQSKQLNHSGITSVESWWPWNDDQLIYL